MRRLALSALTCVVALCCSVAHAAINCSISSNGFSVGYNPNAPGNNISQTSFTVSCSREFAADPATVAYSVTVNNGNNAQGVNNRAAFGANFMRYDVFLDSACSSKWKGTTAITGSVSMPTTGMSYSSISTFWSCILPGQAVPAGTYTDTILMTLSYGAIPAKTALGTFGVAIVTPSVCSISTSPGTITMNYTSFGAPANGSTTFGVTCTQGQPYTMALDATAGTLLGLNYTLGLSTGASAGTGAQQLHTINGAIAAGQSGACPTANCTASAVRGVTVTY